MKAMSARDAKHQFGLLIDTARAEPVVIEKHGRAVVVVVAVEEFERLRELLGRLTVPFPKGVEQPQRTAATSTVFLRDPRVKAYVLRRAKGKCEACSNPAPFRTTLGLDFLEVHHMKPLAEGGSDRVQNAVALCPNCHRAMHNAADAKERADQLYSRMGGSLLRES